MSITETIPPRRRLFLPSLMWIVFITMIGAAALLIKAKSGLWKIDLADAAEYGSIELRLPRGWTVHHQGDGIKDQIQAQETTAPRRSLRITMAHSDMGIDAMEFNELNIGEVEKIEITNGEGWLIHPRRGGSSLALLNFIDGRTVIVEMDGQGTFQASDDAILYHVANSIRLKPGNKIKPPSTGGREI